MPDRPVSPRITRRAEGQAQINISHPKTYPGDRTRQAHGIRALTDEAHPA